mmetsp:Transcript_138739/g.386897  ORF Transcript_138739/g.386897 Transcript_138739/m.386897 type:complete len:212 (+) Transcript_138739:129-764(+)
MHLTALLDICKAAVLPSHDKAIRTESCWWRRPDLRCIVRCVQPAGSSEVECPGQDSLSPEQRHLGPRSVPGGCLCGGEVIVRNVQPGSDSSPRLGALDHGSVLLHGCGTAAFWEVRAEDDVFRRHLEAAVAGRKHARAGPYGVGHSHGRLNPRCGNVPLPEAGRVHGHKFLVQRLYQLAVGAGDCQWVRGVRPWQARPIQHTTWVGFRASL